MYIGGRNIKGLCYILQCTHIFPTISCSKNTVYKTVLKTLPTHDIWVMFNMLACSFLITAPQNYNKKAKKTNFYILGKAESKPFVLLCENL